MSREQEKDADLRVEAAKARRQEVRDEVRGISEDYHPFDLQTGLPRQADAVNAALNQRFDRVEQLAEQFNVPQGRRKLVGKARKNVVNMVATIAYFWNMFWLKIGALNVSDEVCQSVTSTLLPAIYLEGVSKRAPDAEQRRRLRALSESLYAKARDGPLRGLETSQREEVQRLATECAGLFQRSSSCVEGRNGHLALHHHGLHRLSTRKLNALTAVHNYFLKRPDGTTAAERFFGSPSRDVFEYLLDRLPFPSRPRFR